MAAGAVELRNEIAKRVGCTLPSTLIFDHPTVAALTAHIVSLLAAKAPAPPVLTSMQEAVRLRTPHQQHTVLLTAMTSRLADSQRACPHGVPSKQDRIQKVPFDRWDPDATYVMLALGQKRSAGIRFGGFVQDWASFDPEAFAIPPSGGLASTAGTCLPPFM